MRFVDALELGADRRRTNHATMQHTGNAEVLHVRELSRQLAWNIEPSNRLAHDLVVVGVFCGARGVDLEGEVLPVDQLRIGDHVAARFRSDRSIRDDEIFFRRSKASGRFVQKRHAGSRRRLADLHATYLGRQAAIGRTLVRGERGVALNDVDVRHGNVELVGDDLSKAGADAGAQLTFPL